MYKTLLFLSNVIQCLHNAVNDGAPYIVRANTAQKANNNMQDSHIELESALCSPSRIE